MLAHSVTNSVCLKNCSYPAAVPKNTHKSLFEKKWTLTANKIKKKKFKLANAFFKILQYSVFNFFKFFLARVLTCRLLHPSKIPSSIALIPFPLKSRSCRFFRPRNSLVENMGFSVSPKRLSANRSSRRVDCSPWSSLSVSLLKELPEKSTVLSGKADLENI